MPRTKSFCHAAFLFYNPPMLLLVNVQNVFLEKCESKRLRVMVEAAELIKPGRVIAWSSPPAEAMGKKIDKETRSEYDTAVYPEIGKLSLPTSTITGVDKLPREFYQEIKKEDEVFLLGCNTQGWLVKIALEMWNVARIRPKFIIEGWFSIGAPGVHGDAMNELTRQFGSGAFHPWESIKEPILKQRAELAAAMKAATSQPIS